MLRSEFDKLLKTIINNKKVASIIDDIGGVRSSLVQSDKIGFDWENTFVGDTLVRQVYVPQVNPVGTADNPIPYYDGIQGINNAFYVTEDGTILVYMSGEFIEM